MYGYEHAGGRARPKWLTSFMAVAGTRTKEAYDIDGEPAISIPCMQNKQYDINNCGLALPSVTTCDDSLAVC